MKDKDIRNDISESYLRMNRRTFVKAAGAAAGALALGGIGLPNFIRGAEAAIPGGNLDPLTIPKYVTPLTIPQAMPVTSSSPTLDYYEIAVREFQQQILPELDALGNPTGLPATAVWSYGLAGDFNPDNTGKTVAQGGSYNYPSFTIEAAFQKPVQVKWINELKDAPGAASGNFRRHLLPVDPTLHWANPIGGEAGRDMRPPRDPTDPYWNNPFIEFDPTLNTHRYIGPIPISVHLHGGHNDQEDDGFPEAWFLPDAADLDPDPTKLARTGTYYNTFKGISPLGGLWTPGSAVFEYDNDQPAATLWFHDHALGMTRTNVQAGPAGFYILRDQFENDLINGTNIAGQNSALSKIPSGAFEIPIVIQDRSFNTDGSLFYPLSRAFFDGFTGPYYPNSDIAPIHNPEFFGNTMVVNGKTWPKLTVEQRRYRFRFLNGSDSRFFILKMSNNLPFYQIGADGGFLPKVQQLPQLLIGPAERADVIVDFTKMTVGTQIILQNIGPDSPFGGGNFTPSDPATTGQVMRFDVVARTSPDNTTRPTDRNLILPAITKLGNPNVTRKVSLNELNSAVLRGVGPRTALLGTVNLAGKGVPLEWEDPITHEFNITENPALGAIEVWEIYNFTADAHPIHIHEIQFEVVNRQPLNGNKVRQPELWESGHKDTVVAYPGEITRVKALYDNAGLFVWHCHILSHEDNEMMRPYRIG